MNELYRKHLLFSRQIKVQDHIAWTDWTVNARQLVIVDYKTIKFYLVPCWSLAVEKGNLFLVPFWL